MDVSKYKFDEERPCRLCGELQENEIQIWGENRDDFVTLIKCTLGYLNIEFVDDDVLPKWICAPCQLDAESTKKFLVLVDDGQRKLREIIERRNAALGKPSSLQGNRNNDPEDSIPYNGNAAEDSLNNNSKSPIKLPNTSDNKKVKIRETPVDLRASVSSKYPKRKRKPTKRFPCNPSPYAGPEDCASGDDADTKCDQSEEISAGTLITLKPIAELCAANGTSLAEMIAIDTEGSQRIASTEEDIRLVCEYCKDVFTTQHLFLKHLRTHNETIYQCTECENVYETLTELKTHQKLEQHKGKTILAKTKTTTRATQKTNSKNTAIIIALDDDGKITSIDSDVKPTVKDDDTKSDHMGPDCKTEQVEINKKGVPSTKTAYKCLKCNKSYSSHYSVLRHHKQVHVGARVFNCQHCSASFTHGNTLTYHMAKHTGIRSNKCDKCPKAFVHRHELTLHMRTHTGDKPYICKHCPKAFAHRSNLVTHMRLHSGQLPFKCETCNALFNSSSHWKLHKERHLKHAQKLVESKLNEDKYTAVESTKTTSRPSSSTVPDFITPTSSLLRPKNIIVKSVKMLPPINALPGPNASINSSELKDVLKNIPPEKSKPSAPLRFECSQCLQRFKLRSALTKHLRTHTGEKPYRCPLCPRAFADASNFKRHKSLHKTATEQLQNVSKQLKSSNFLNELQRDKTKSMSLPLASLSPTHSIASDPDPDGLEAIARTNAIMSPKSAIDLSDSDDADIMLAILDDVAAESLQQLASTTSTTSVATTSQQLVCISYANPTNPSDNKTTSFYL